jgi:hypothetical protein
MRSFRCLMPAVLLASCFLAGTPARADNVIDLNITSDTILDGSYVANFGVSINVYGSAHVILTPGSEVSSSGPSTIRAHDTSTIDILSWRVNALVGADDDSTVNVLAGSVNNAVAAGGTVNAIGGYTSILNAADGGTVNLSGGAVGELRAHAGGTVNYTGGAILYGGPDGGAMRIFDGGTVHVTGTNLSVDPPVDLGWGDVGGLLTGTLLDGTELRVWTIVAPKGRLVLHTATPAQRIAVLQASVQALIASGAVLPADGQPLQAKLVAAKSAASAGNTRDAIGSLTAFGNQVRAFVKSRRLTAAQGAALTDAAARIITQLQGA